ncbi:MAG: DUF2393 family protein [Sulfuricurvum sp.]|uniref:DUF2393 family protein n=1 Tax=Sulfuricurvum sp. TaxID=2025608 RepID=UPI002614AA99|nr:DUF2393 family protein [Sulfuricurvum sp.]MDD2368959.1 DUF2393 family protein [Sulfuricurvum sp.]MDD2950063.1 DUF2393 family protein [Sulfuricurvum sp.]MDD5117723.1 DUF2393 family protein [Sulfuricurvum sp.]
MNIYLTVWHYLVLGIALLLIILSIFSALQAKRLIQQLAILFASFIVIIAGAFIVLAGLESYTKKAKIFNLKHDRLLQSEQIVFTGVVKNMGEYPLARVQLELTLQNTQKQQSGIFGGAPHAFNEAFDTKYQPQTINYYYTVATDLPPGYSKAFTIMIDYPPYFNDTSYRTKAVAH